MPFDVRPRRIVVGVSGASGAALGLECLKCLRQAGAESALVVTRGERSPSSRSSA